MTPKRRKVWIGLGVIVLLLVAIPMLWPVDEPKYNGRYLSEWLEMYEEYRLQPLSRGNVAAQEAVRSIGTNALPYYLDWIDYELDYELPPWRMTLRRNLPGWMRGNPIWDRILIGKTERRASYAIWGIGILGTNAISVVPALESLIKDSSKPSSSFRAMFALASIGEPSLPILKSALADTKQINRAKIPYALSYGGWIASLQARTYEVQPILIEATRDLDTEVRRNARIVLGQEVLTNAPSK